jgi:hypothetical protein
MMRQGIPPKNKKTSKISTNCAYCINKKMEQILGLWLKKKGIANPFLEGKATND